MGEAESLGRKVIVRQIRIAPGQEAAELEQGETELMIVQLRAGELVTVVDGQRRQRQEREWWARSLTELADQEGVTVAYVCRLLPLACLAPDIVEAILDGWQPKGLRLAGMLGMGRWAGRSSS